MQKRASPTTIISEQAAFGPFVSISLSFLSPPPPMSKLLLLLLSGERNIMGTSEHFPGVPRPILSKTTPDVLREGLAERRLLVCGFVHLTEKFRDAPRKLATASAAGFPVAVARWF